MDLRNKVPFFMNYANGYVDTVSGTSPLSLPKAKAGSLKSVKLFGGTEQRNLPEGYTQLEYLEVATEGAYFSTGIDANVNTDMGITVSNVTSSSAQLLVAQCVSGGDYFRIVKAVAIQRIIGYLGSSSVTDNNTTGITKVTARINKSGFYVNGSLVGTFSNIPSSLTDVGEIEIFRGKYSNSTYFTYPGSRFHSAWIDDNIFLPCRRNSDNQLGIYNTKTGEFILPSGTGAFTAGSDVTAPSPDAPMDIVSNNGVVKARHQSGLPLGYTLLEYIESTGTQYIDTGIAPNNTTGFHITYSPYDVQIDASQFGVRQTPNQDTRFWFGVADGKGYFGWDTNLPNRPSITANEVHTVALNYLNNRKATFDNVDYYTEIPTLTTSYTRTFKLFGVSSGDNILYRRYKMKEAVFTSGNSMSHHFIPARRESDGVLGMYDLADNNPATALHPNAGTGTFTAGNPVSDPVEIYTDGTVETINVHGKNLFDSDAILQGYIDANGDLQSSTNIGRSALIPVAVGETYTWSGTHNRNNATNKRLHGYDSNGDWVEQLGSTAASLDTNYSVTVTIPSGIAYVCLSGIRLDTPDTNVQFELGSTATTYEPYYDGGTATAEMLLKVGDYQDVQSIIDGVVTRNVGVKVLDGTEDIGKSGVYRGSFFVRNVVSGWGTSNNAPVYCSHFGGVTEDTDYVQNKCIVLNNAFNMWWASDNTPTVAQFQQWLADQYAAGTPVIIVYPLAESTTESVAGQTLQVQAGNNTLEITQASLNNLELEAKYRRNK